MIGLIMFSIVGGFILISITAIERGLECFFEYIAEKLEHKHPLIFYPAMFLICAVPIATTYFIVDKYAS